MSDFQWSSGVLCFVMLCTVVGEATALLLHCECLIFVYIMALPGTFPMFALLGGDNNGGAISFCYRSLQAFLTARHRFCMTKRCTCPLQRDKIFLIFPSPFAFIDVVL